MDWAVSSGRQKKREIPVGPDQLYRDLMGVYAALMKCGIAPSQIDETELEDLFAILDSMKPADEMTQSTDDSWY